MIALSIGIDDWLLGVCRIKQLRSEKLVKLVTPQFVSRFRVQALACAGNCNLEDELLL
jgi:hypothetical protein